MKLGSLRKSLPSQICFTLTLHGLICDTFSSILHSSCTTKDTTVIFLKTWKSQFVAIENNVFKVPNISQSESNIGMSQFQPFKENSS
jgi:hypothetical protein